MGCVTVSRQNIRRGPGLEYVAQKSIPLGTCVTLVGRNDAYTWVLQKDGWLYAPLLDIQGNISQLPVSENIHTTTQSVDNNDVETSCPDGCTTSIPNCYIKGNISSSAGEKKYYLPDQKGYTSITISPEFGERWFCTEEEAETKAAQQIGVQSTPSFLINGQPVIGAQPFEAFQQVIDALLTAN